jgi:pimeloyl-ACP methyl ester carboxylesterase
MTDGRLAVSGHTLSYTTAGSGEPLLLLHGLGGTRRTWRQVLGPLAAEHTVIVPDLPGHGESAAPAGDYSLGTHAAAMRDLLIALGHPRATLIGHSLGGSIALQFAYQFPDRINRLVLISSGGLGVEVTSLLRAATLPGAGMVVAGLGQLPEAVIRGVLPMLSFLPGFLARQDARPLAAMVRGLGEAGQRRGFIRTARAVLNWRGQTVSPARHLGLLPDLPVLLAWGSKDTTIPARHHQDLARRLPNPHLVEIMGAGHFPHESAPARLLPPLHNFLRSTAPFQYDEGRWRHLLTQPPS